MHAAYCMLSPMQTSSNLSNTGGAGVCAGRKKQMKLITIEWSKSEWMNQRNYMSNRIPTYRGAARIIANMLNEQDGHEWIRPRDITIHRIESAVYSK